MDTATVPFGLDVRIGARALMIAVHGELDAATAPEMTRALATAMAESKGRVSLDLADVKFVDSNGLAALTRARRSYADGGRTLSLRRPSDGVRRLVALSGLAPYLGMRQPSNE
jgi:anti-sigma B factor antagonist